MPPTPQLALEEHQLKCFFQVQLANAQNTYNSHQWVWRNIGMYPVPSLCGYTTANHREGGGGGGGERVPLKSWQENGGSIQNMLNMHARAATVNLGKDLTIVILLKSLGSLIGSVDTVTVGW